MNEQPKSYKRIVTGGSASVGGAFGSIGLGISTSLVATDASHCRKLLDFIDDKRAFIELRPRDDGARVVASLQEVRKFATSTASLLESLEAVTEVKNIASACRKFMDNYEVTDSASALHECMHEARAQVGTSIEVLRELFSLPELENFDTSPYRQSGIEILEGWLDRRP